MQEVTGSLFPKTTAQPCLALLQTQPVWLQALTRGVDASKWEMLLLIFLPELRNPSPALAVMGREEDRSHLSQWLSQAARGWLMEPFVIISDNQELWGWTEWGFVAQLPGNRSVWSHPQVWSYKPCKVSPGWVGVWGFCKNSQPIP